MARLPKTKAQSSQKDDSALTQPAWRKAPPRPRKQARRRTFAAQQSGGKAQRDGMPGALALPARETVYGWLRIGALLLMAAAVAGGLYGLLHWPMLMISGSTTHIGGAVRIAPEDIYKQSQIDGRNIILVRRDEVAGNVKDLAGILDAEVHLRLPNQIIIDVVENAPLVALETVTTTLWLAEDGAEVPQSGAQPPIRIVDQSNNRLTRDLALRSLILENVAQLHALRPSIAEFYYGGSEGLYYRSSDGWDVWLGEGGPVAEKLGLIDVAASEVVKQGGQPKVIDVRHSGRKALWW